MFRSAEFGSGRRPAGWLRIAAVAGALTAAVCLTPAQGAFAADQVPVLDITAGPVVITAPVLDISTTVTSLDGSVADERDRDSTRITLAADVLFAFDKAELSPTGTSRLTQTVTLIRSRTSRAGADGSKVIRIDGYTDSLGATAYNQGLSQRRAASVTAALTKLLGSGYELRSAGHGASDPVAANTKPDGTDNPAGRAQNRRVTVSFSS